MADERTEKQKVQEITDKLEEGLKELLRVKSTRLIFPPCQNFIITALTTLYLSPCKSRKQHL